LDNGWTQELLNWLSAHPGWGFITVLLVALFESLVLIGILLPGMFILFGIGALIGLGVLDMMPMWIAATIGAFLGDFISYLLGHRFRGALVDIWPFSRYPVLMERGTHFFHRHGAKSVMAGRFIGPLRPIIPAVGGMMGMKPSRFLAVNIPACILWSPAFLLPGVLFGASLEVASQYTGRLTMMLIILVVLLWITWWAIRAIYEPLASRSARWVRRLIRWSRRHPLLGRVASPMIDPSRPEALSVTMMGILLVVVFWGLIMLLFMSPFSSQPQALDQAVRDLALSLRNHLADPAMVALSQLSRWQVSVFSALALLLWLFGAGRKKAAVHWLIAILGGALLHLLLSWSLRTTPEVLELADRILSSPSAAMSLSTVVLTFFAVMEAGELPRRHRQWPYLAAALLLLLLGISRIYLGLEWLSGALMGVTAGLAWTAVVGFAYRQRATRHFSGGVASMIFFGSMFALFMWQVNEHTEEDLSALQTTTVLQELAAEDWWDGAWSTMPMERTRVSSIATHRFNAQVAVDPTAISRLLEQSGWEQVPDTDWRWFLQALNPEPDQFTLPLLGRAYLGRPEVLLLKKNIDGTDRLFTIRLWDSGVRLLPDQKILYLGQMAEEVLDRRFGLFSYWRAVPLEHQLVIPIREALAPLEQKTVAQDLLLVRD
jgi:undecaprenyl-diphosphatase